MTFEQMREAGLGLMKRFPPKPQPDQEGPGRRRGKPLSEEELKKEAIALLGEGPRDDRKSWSNRIYALRLKMEKQGMDTSMLPPRKVREKIVV